MNGTIHLVRCGVSIKQYPMEHYSINLLNGMVTLHDKEARRIAAILSPNSYDWIEFEYFEGTTNVNI